jgi:phage baseplate assembly protein W
MSTVQPTAAQLSLQNANWIDTNTLVTQNGLPDRLPDVLSINYCSLINLLFCPIGARSRTFNPTYGCVLFQLLQEPIDDGTAALIQMGFIQAIQRWEPRISIDFNNTTVTPDFSIPGYQIQLAYTINLTGVSVTQTFVVGP